MLRTAIIGLNQFIQDNIIDLDNRIVIYKRGDTLDQSKPFYEVVFISSDQINDVTCLRTNETLVLVRATSTEQYEAFKMADDLVAILDGVSTIDRLDEDRTNQGIMRVKEIRREALPELFETNLYSVGVFITLRWSEPIDQGD